MAAATVDHAPARPRFDWWLLLVVLGSIIACAPFLRTVYALTDEGQLLNGADRMLRGRRLYGDFFEFLPPGGFVATAGWLWLTGTSLAWARALAILVIVGAAAFTYLASRAASRRSALSAGLVLGWMALSQGEWTGISHHWFTTLFSCVTAWAAVAACGDERGRLRWPVTAGLAGGAAAMTTPTRGALVMLAAIVAFLDRRRPWTFIVYALAGLAVPVALIGYLLLQGTFGAAFDDVIRWTAENYVSVQPVPFGEFATPQNQLLVYVFPAAALLAVLAIVQGGRPSLGDRRLMTCISLALAGFIGAFPRPDAVHLGFNCPLAIPLIALCATRLTQRWRPAYRYALAAAIIGFSVPGVRSFWWLYQRALLAETTGTPRGAVALIGPPSNGRFIARMGETPPGDTYFFYPYVPLLPFLTGREHVVEFDIFNPGYTTTDQYRQACVSAVQRATWLVFERSMADPVVLKQWFPATPDPNPPEKRQFEQAAEQAFPLVARDGTLELRRRRDGLDVAVCAGITG
ncbi:MAG: hypothetical protein WDN25_02560 [Acetobacteraceae bacterium]